MNGIGRISVPIAGGEKMCENKSQQLLVRMSPYESGLLGFLSEETHLSRAEILRLGIRIIARDLTPSDVPQLKAFYAEQKGGENI